MNFKHGAIPAVRTYLAQAAGCTPARRVELVRALAADLCRVYRAPAIELRATAGDHAYREHATHPHLDRLLINPGRALEMNSLLAAIGAALCKPNPHAWGLELALKAAGAPC